MDTFFISHGSPITSIDDKLPARRFMQSWQEKILEAKPKSILVVSAHWETLEPTVSAPDQYDTIHDITNFPKVMYELEYNAPVARELAKRVLDLLNGAGLNAKEDNVRGIDHGAWVPLMLMYPEADIPVCQLSVQPELDGTHHYNMGRSLAPLKEEGVLIVGSGGAVHNEFIHGHEDGPVLPWAVEFDNWLMKALMEGRHEDVNHYEERAPEAKMAHPTPEHFIPLHVALGAAGEKAKAELIHHSWELSSSLSYASYRFSTS